MNISVGSFMCLTIIKRYSKKWKDMLSFLVKYKSYFGGFTRTGAW